ncbi:MAG: DNA-binding response regulator [Bacteroidetes bacterium GWF2_49_14]|nr:MAG: DNA-binding response regulator [Bacteroidetes bacterium GWF2_49_14]HBB91854.1 DNA-binding response regulator [Bacteroidales bacterium]
MNDTGSRILLVDDEPDILEFLGYNLIVEGYKVEKARNGAEAIRMAKTFKPDLILLDVMMPGSDGIETCEQIRRLPELKGVMIAFLTARGEDYSQIAGFSAGGDDYITKPVKPKVLVSRIKALLKRVRPGIQPEEADTVMRIGDMEIDRVKYLVTAAGVELQLPRKEFELLSLLASKPGRVMTREEIFRKVWGDDVIVGERTIDVHIRKLREKIGEKYIQTIKGVGYKFSTTSEG